MLCSLRQWEAKIKERKKEVEDGEVEQPLMPETLWSGTETDVKRPRMSDSSFFIVYVFIHSRSNGGAFFWGGGERKKVSLRNGIKWPEIA